MTTIRAVLFDFGGTLYDYATLQTAESESLVELARWAGSTAEPSAILRTYRDAMRRVFRRYLPLPFYLHRDLFRDAIVELLADLGVAQDDALLDRYRAQQWQRHARDFTLRAGVIETLQAIRGRGVHVGMVSNIDDEQLDHLLDICELRPYFDATLSSERAGSCKPDAAIFTAALQQADCEPHEALFVGDTIVQDVAGANRAGMRSVLLWHRTDRPPPDVGPRPRHVINHIPELLALLA